MASSATCKNLENEAKLWLAPLFVTENIINFDVSVVGGCNKGDGYFGDILFVQLTTTSKSDKHDYHLVLKCSKRSHTLRVKSPIKEIFLNEIYIYEKILPTLQNFQRMKGIKDIFNSVPKFYGSFIDGDIEVVVLENLAESGYALWDKAKPLSRPHIYLVIDEYAFLHATAVAFQDQQPHNYEKIVREFDSNPMLRIMKDEDYLRFHEENIEQCRVLLEDQVDRSVLQKWKALKGRIREIFSKLTDDFEGMKVLVHGDCWNNNFMFKETAEVAILDWQLSRLSSPIHDLSYFLFACISKDDMENLTEILLKYHRAFSTRLEQLGSDPQKLYPLDHFLDDWHNYAIYGVLTATWVIKLAATDKNDVTDIEETAEEGKSLLDTFRYHLKSEENYKSRIKPIIEYAVKNKLV